MRLLIVTQVVDIEHPILGFFHRWLEEFAKNCETVEVICLEAGKHSLPANVTIHSLGKEEGKGRLVYLWRFFKLTWTLRKNYDSVFVHMNQVYVLLGGLLWRISGKRVGLWYMHGTVSPSLKLAEKITNKIFTGSKESCRIESNKIIITGHGIDTEKFKIENCNKDLDLITVGRITESKNLKTLIDILEEVRTGKEVSLTIVGGAVTASEQGYENELKEYIKNKGLTEKVIFYGRVNQEALPNILNRAKVFVTTAKNGSLDKAVLEAMACGLPAVSMAEGTRSLPLDETQVSNKEEFIVQVKKVLESNVFSDESNRICVETQHSLKSLIPKILSDL